MIEITDKSYKPNILEIEEYIGNPLFRELFDYMDAEYSARNSIEYSGDNNLPGWNVRFYKSGRSLCRLYPEHGRFKILLVVGRKEKEKVESLLPQMSEEMRTIYNNTKEGMGQRWLLFELEAPNAFYNDLKKLVNIRRYSN